MDRVTVHNLIADPILVTRDAARLLEPAIRHLTAAGDQPVVLDFMAVEGVAPSFLDELITVLERVAADGFAGVVICNAPMRMSQKFAAIARGHRLACSIQSDGSWLLTPNPVAPDPSR